jgi:hypothetical protein
MAATCYRCTYEAADPPGDPFGVCKICSSLMCRNCGNRVPKRPRFLCVICIPSAVLLPSAGLPPAGDGPPGGGEPGGGDPDPHDPSGGGGGAEAVFANSREFERLMPDFAAESSTHRKFFREEVPKVLERAREYAFDQVRREDIDAEIGYGGYSDEEEEERRREAMGGAQLLSRHVEGAESEGVLHRVLLADAFGMAAWSIGIPPDSEAPPERLALLADPRLRFVLGYAAPSIAANRQLL